MAQFALVERDFRARASLNSLDDLRGAEIRALLEGHLRNA